MAVQRAVQAVASLAAWERVQTVGGRVVLMVAPTAAWRAAVQRVAVREAAGRAPDQRAAVREARLGVWLARQAVDQVALRRQARWEAAQEGCAPRSHRR